MSQKILLPAKFDLYSEEIFEKHKNRKYLMKLK